MKCHLMWGMWKLTVCLPCYRLFEIYIVSVCILSIQLHSRSGPAVIWVGLKDWPFGVQTSLKRKLLHFALHLEMNVWLSIFIADVMNKAHWRSLCLRQPQPSGRKVLVWEALGIPLPLCTWLLRIRAEWWFFSLNFLCINVPIVYPERRYLAAGSWAGTEQQDWTGSSGPWLTSFMYLFMSPAM